MGSKAVELECLNLVIQYSKYQHGNSRKILNLFNNNDFERVIDERPDFVKYCPLHTKNEKDILLGIEHFQVDHFSDELKENKVGGKTIKYRNDIRLIQQKYNVEIKNTDNIPNDAINKFSQLVARGLYNRYNATYNAFLSAFKFSLEKHMDKVQEYRNNMTSMSAGRFQIKLAFLVEIYSSFSNLFLTTSNGTKLSDDNFIPIFDDLICLIEKIDKKKVDYVVLCFRDAVSGKQNEVIALQTENIRKQLKKRHIKIYQYVGEDYPLPNFQRMQESLDVKPDTSFNGEIIDMEMQIASRELSVESRMDLIMPVFLRALKYKKSGMNFATTQLVQVMIELFGDYYMPFIDDADNFDMNNLRRYFMTIHKDDINAKLHAFEQKWFPEQNEPIM